MDIFDNRFLQWQPVKPLCPISIYCIYSDPTYYKCSLEKSPEGALHVSVSAVSNKRLNLK